MTLHLRCGYDIIPQLREAGLPGRMARWDDPLCEGPLREWPDDAARRAERAFWLAGRYEEPESVVRQNLEAADRALLSGADEDEVVLWFEHDLFDQAILVFLLHRLAELAPERTTLICIDSFPGVPAFIGLGQLNRSQLAELYPGRRPISAEQFALARRAWGLLATGDPEGLWALGAERSLELPFLGMALRRYLAELPSVRNGLSQTESLGLQSIGAGADTPGHAFVAVQRFERHPWQGDAMFYATLRGLADGPYPLLSAGGMGGRLPRLRDATFPNTRLELTPDGRAVLTGRIDWCRLAQRPRRLGGIPIEAAEPAWRWDEEAERPVKTI